MTNSSKKSLPSPAHEVVRFVDDDNFQKNYDAWLAKASQGGVVEIIDRDYIKEQGAPTHVYIYYRVNTKPVTVISGRSAIRMR